MDRKALRRAYDDYRAEVLALLADLDPIGLTDIGVPEDEYAPEASELMSLRHASPTEVRDVFVRAFGPDTGGLSDEAATELAAALAAVRARYPF